MAKEVYDRSKPHVNIGTIGHKSEFLQLLSALLSDV